MLARLYGVMDILSCADEDSAGGILFITASTLVSGAWYWFVGFPDSGFGD